MKRNESSYIMLIYKVLQSLVLFLWTLFNSHFLRCFVTRFCDRWNEFCYLCTRNHTTEHNMNTKETAYKKEPVRLQLRQRAGGKQVVHLEFYKEGVRTYERIPDMMIVSETDQKAIKANQAD